MICLRFGLAVIYLFVLCDFFSFVLAQSIYDFKGKSTNIREGNRVYKPGGRVYESGEKTSDDEDRYSRRSQYRSGDSKLDSPPKKIRFRYLYGTYSTDYQEAERTTYSLIWDGAGIGQSIFKYATTYLDDYYELEHKSIDLSYTFGNDYTLTLGNSAIYSGELTMTTNDNYIYSSSSVVGYGYFMVFGIELGIFEILFAYQYVRYAFIEMESDSTSAYMASFKDSGNQYASGIGISF